MSENVLCYPLSFGQYIYKIWLETIYTKCGYSNGAPLVADLFLFCYERDFMLSLSDINQTDIIEAFNSTSRYLDDLLNVDYPYFEQMVGQIFPTELQLNKVNSSDTEVRKGAKIRNRYNQVPHLTQDTKWKVTNS